MVHGLRESYRVLLNVCVSVYFGECRSAQEPWYRVALLLSSARASRWRAGLGMELLEMQGTGSAAGSHL